MHLLGSVSGLSTRLQKGLQGAGVVGQGETNPKVMCPTAREQAAEEAAHQPCQFHTCGGNQGWGVSYTGQDLVHPLRADQCRQHACWSSVGKIQCSGLLVILVFL